jgi:prepilin-type N-terminal cleavage/methylation domain-containing protein
MVFNFFLTRSRHVVEKIRSFFCYPEITKNAQAGFTMIEMLTVISIMSLIGSITLARTFEARRLAQDTKVIQDTKSLIKVFQAYYLDHGYFPGLTSAQANSVQNTYSNFGCPSVHICDYSAVLILLLVIIGDRVIVLISTTLTIQLREQLGGRWVGCQCSMELLILRIVISRLSAHQKMNEILIVTHHFH